MMAEIAQTSRVPAPVAEREISLSRLLFGSSPTDALSVPLLQVGRLPSELVETFKSLRDVYHVSVQTEPVALPSGNQTINITMPHRPSVSLEIKVSDKPSTVLTNIVDSVKLANSMSVEDVWEAINSESEN